MTAQAFVDQYRPTLLQYLDPNTHDELEVGPLAFVDNLLDDWYERFGHTRLPPADLAERTFWFSLYLLEEVEENNLQGYECDWTRRRRAELQSMHKLLAAGAELPDDKWATRPGELVDDEFDDDALYD